MAAGVLLLLALVAMAAASLNYQVGQELEFAVHATLDSRGANVDTGATTGGVISTMDSILAMKCVQKNATGFLFVMNLFNTEVNVQQDGDVTQPTLVGSDDDGSLGDDCYFYQTLDGQILTIWYQEGDSPYFVNVKVGAINALQTRLISPGPAQTLLETDPVGVHYSVFQSSSGQMLEVNKTFTVADIESFADPNVQRSNVRYAGSGSVLVHPDGYVASAAVQHQVMFVHDASSVANDDNPDFSVALASAGAMTLTLSQQQLQPVASRFTAVYTMEALAEQRSMVSSTLLEAARAGMQATQMEVDEDAVKAFGAALGADRFMGSTMHRYARLMARSDALAAEARALLLAAAARQDTTQQRRLLTTLALAGTAAAQEVLAAVALQPASPVDRLAAVLAAAHTARPSPALLQALAVLAADAAAQGDVRSSALLALGACAARVAHTDPAAYHEAVLQLLAVLAAAERAGDAGLVAAGVRAAANARLPVDLLPAAVRNSAQPNVRRALQHGRRTAAVAGASSFPYNVSWAKEVQVGGKMASLQVGGLLFAGTNFDCNQPTFNYEAQAQASGTVGLFGDTHDAFLAEAVYGRENGAPLANEILLSVWDQVLYDKPLPALDCAPHSYPLYHAAPGFAVSYTLWVTIIPVTFTAAATLQLNVQWDWQVCDADLSAQVEITPAAAVTLSGSAELNLLIIRGTTEIDGSFNEAIVPQAYIHGSLCTVGLDVKRTNTPMSVDLHSFYTVKKCKFLIFDCHDGPEHDKTWWSWSAPQSQEVLFQQEWHIR